MRGVLRMTAKREKEDKKMEEVTAMHAEEMAIAEEVRREIAKEKGEAAEVSRSDVMIGTLTLISDCGKPLATSSGIYLPLYRMILEVQGDIDVRASPLISSSISCTHRVQGLYFPPLFSGI